MFYFKLTISTPMKDITVQNVRLHLQENISKVISSLFYIHCYFWPLFLSLLMCFTLSKMQLEILKKIYFQFFTCPVHFPFLFANLLKTDLFSIIYGTTMISTRNNNHLILHNIMLSGYCTNKITNMPGIFLVKNNTANQIAGIHH